MITYIQVESVFASQNSFKGEIRTEQGKKVVTLEYRQYIFLFIYNKESRIEILCFLNITFYAI